MLALAHEPVAGQRRFTADIFQDLSPVLNIDTDDSSQVRLSITSFFVSNWPSCRITGLCALSQHSDQYIRYWTSTFSRRTNLPLQPYFIRTTKDPLDASSIPRTRWPRKRMGLIWVRLLRVRSTFYHGTSSYPVQPRFTRRSSIPTSIRTVILRNARAERTWRYRRCIVCRILGSGFTSSVWRIDGP